MSILRGDVMRRAVNVCLIKGFCLWILLIKCHSTPKLTPSRNSICWSQRSNCTPSTTHTNRLQLLKVIGNFNADKDGSSLNTKHSLINTFQIFPSHPKNSREMNPLVTNNCLLRPTRFLYNSTQRLIHRYSYVNLSPLSFNIHYSWGIKHGNSETL